MSFKGASYECLAQNMKLEAIVVDRKATFVKNKLQCENAKLAQDYLFKAVFFQKKTRY